MRPFLGSVFHRTWLLVFFLHLTFAAYEIKRGSPEFWTKVAQDELKMRRMTSAQPRRAKNIILFIGDGMSIATVTAARMWKAQRAKDREPGRKLLSFEDVPFVGLSKTYTDDFMVSDSAATATAMLTGVKINSLTVGVDSRVQFRNCSSYSPKNNIKNIFSYAKEVGIATGLVTTTSLTHATPSAAYGHSANRFWVNDVKLAKDVKTAEGRKRCRDLASQFLTNARDFDVILGGGWGDFRPESVGGQRKDGRDILQEWTELQKRRNLKSRLVQSKEALKKAATDRTLNRLLGVFAPSHLPFTDEMALPEHRKVPSLAEMTDAAVRYLSRHDRGFLLLVEGGRIDHGHHKGMSQRALRETLGLDAAFTAARRLVPAEDTLLLTTADHSHVFTVGGYPSRGTDIFGFPKQDTEGRGPSRAADGLPFTILLYGNGPGAPNGVPRPDPGKDTSAPQYRPQAAVPLRKETHGGDDVPIYAAGPMAHLAGGVREQNFLAHLMMHAACLGPYRDAGDCPSAGGASTAASAAALAAGVLAALWGRAGAL